MKKRRWGLSFQSVIEYVIFLLVIVLAILEMQVYLRRAVSGKWKESIDVFGKKRQYEPKPEGCEDFCCIKVCIEEGYGGDCEEWGAEKYSYDSELCEGETKYTECPSTGRRECKLECKEWDEYGNCINSEPVVE